MAMAVRHDARCIRRRHVRAEQRRVPASRMDHQSLLSK
jgi:hypothetical protein